MEKELIVIPVYNEKETLVEVLCAIREYYSGCVLLIDDGSTDGSIETINTLCLECDHKKIHSIAHDRNLGYGAALISGFDFAINKNYDYVLTMDCDWQHEPSYIPEFFMEVRNYDLVSGSRYLENFEVDTNAPNDRKKINMYLSEILTKETSFKITDSFCGFKAYKVEALKKLDLNETGYAFPMEFWVEACMKKLSFKELSVPRIYTGAKRSFGGILDNPDVRLAHYLDTFKKAKAKYKGKECQSIY